MDGQPWSVLMEEPYIFYLGSQILNVFSERYPVFTENSQFSRVFDTELLVLDYSPGIKGAEMPKANISGKRNFPI